VPTPTPETYAESIRRFQIDCETHHQSCVPRWKNTTEYLPTRLLYVGPTSPSYLPILCEPAVDLHIPGLSDRRCNYIALSHCWGQKQIITTRKDNLKSHKLGIAWSALSLTFQEAITMTRALGIDFIWIDSLCIIQDDSSDWAFEAAQMASVYENSCLTLGATGSASGAGGLFPRSRPQIKMHNASICGAPHDIYTWRLHEHTLHPEGRWNTEASLPLTSRAWCFQERMLSKSFVHFTPAEIVWECLEHVTCECGNPEGSSNEPSSYSIPRLRDPTQGHGREWHTSPGINAWSKVVNRMSRKDITFERDRLPALSALAGEFHMDSDTYLAGLWRRDLPLNLLWEVTSGPSNRRPDPGPEPSCTPPTWSWVSVNTAGVRDQSDQNLIPRAEVVEAEVYPNTSDPRGTVSGGHITLKGQIFPIRFSNETRGEDGAFQETLPFRPSLVTNDLENLRISIEMGSNDNICSIFYRIDRPQEVVRLIQLEQPVYFMYLAQCRKAGAKPYGLLLTELSNPTGEQLSVGSRTRSALICERIGFARGHIGWCIGDRTGQPSPYILKNPIETVTIF
jgi:hypothetical protein